MELITLRFDLQERLALKAQEVAKSVSDLVNEAVERYLHEQQRRKLDEEVAVYERLHADLQQTHLGQWVAIHGGQLVDHDPDGATLYRRVRVNYGGISVLIRQVTAHPVEEVWVRTPTTGRVQV